MFLSLSLQEDKPDDTTGRICAYIGKIVTYEKYILSARVSLRNAFERVHSTMHRMTNASLGLEIERDVVRETDRRKGVHTRNVSADHSANVESKHLFCYSIIYV